MSKNKELLSKIGLRLDGRKEDELRRIQCKLGVFTEPDGSAYLEQGLTKVLAAVYGPHQVRNRSKAQHDTAVINCQFSMAVFSTGERKRRPRGDRKSSEMSNHLKQALMAAIKTELYAWSQIDVYVEVLHADGGIYPACVNAATLALIDAGIPLREYVCACTASLANGDVPLVDVSYHEEIMGGPTLTIAALPISGNIVLMEMSRRFHLYHLPKVLETALQGCKDIRAILDQAVKNHVAEVGSSTEWAVIGDKRYATNAVQINFIRIPGAVRNNTGTAVVLDCNYTVRPDDEGLVVKWFLNGGSNAVYQWIPPKKPQALGILRNRLDLSYKISNDPKKAYRALRIINPTTDIAGDYKCFVSTFTDEDFTSKYMIVYEPEEKLLMYLGTPTEKEINFTCVGIGVYPEPKLIMYKNMEDQPTYEPKTILEVNEWTKSRHQSGKYDLSIVVSVPLDNLSPGDIVDCELRIPGTGYVKKKSIIYYPPLEKNIGASILSMFHIVLVVSVWIILFI